MVLVKDNIRKLTTASDWQVSEFFNLIATSYKAYVFKDIFSDKETLNKINIILTANGYFAVINLGLPIRLLRIVAVIQSPN